MNQDSREPWRWFLFALVLRVAIVGWAADRVPPTADGSFYHVVAQRIAHGDGYTWLWPDGAVTYAAHYPVGYPTLVGLTYRLFGPHVSAAMIMNALLGALGSYFVFIITRRWLASESPKVRTTSARAATLLYALSPTLLFYTPALMTEGVVATFLLGAIVLAGRCRDESSARRRWIWLSLLGVVLGLATLVRPQNVILAPFFGFFSLVERTRHGVARRLLAAAAVSILAVATVAPWTIRNCEKMESCVFVSANGGWNLLIGTYPEGRGAWVGIDGTRVPEECRTVFQEAKKDLCFGAAGRRRIVDEPGAWLRLVPAKLRVTFDYTGIAADHLQAAGALTETSKWWLAATEIVSHRVLGLLAWVGLLAFVRPGLRTRIWWFGVASFAAVLGSAAYGSFAILGLVGLLGARRLDRPELQLPLITLLATLAIHAVFFGAGRYFLPLIALLAPLSGFGLATLRRTFDSR